MVTLYTCKILRYKSKKPVTYTLARYQNANSKTTTLYSLKILKCKKNLAEQKNDHYIHLPNTKIQHPKNDHENTFVKYKNNLQYKKVLTLHSCKIPKYKLKK